MNAQKTIETCIPEENRTSEECSKVKTPSILYVHGLSSSGSSSTAGFLRQMLPEYEILSPDLPIEPQEACAMLKKLCELHQPALVIGTSMGGMFAQQLRGYKKILVNPAFNVSESMRNKLGVRPFLNPRKNGETQYEITPELCGRYQALEANQFAGISAYDIENTYALFGKYDPLVGERERKAYVLHYRNALEFEGEHRLSENIVRTVVVPLIRKIAQQ